MSYGVRAAIDFLAAQISVEDPAASSHWRLFHKDFALNSDGSFSGLSGFGGGERPHRGLRHVAHRVLQMPYRRIARRYASFAQLDAVASSVLDVQQRGYNLDALRQTITLAFLKHHLPQLGPSSVVAVIGDGFASMATLLLASGCARQVVLVNLNKTLLVDLAYFQRWLGGGNDKMVRLVVDSAALREALASPEVRLIAVQARHHQLLREAPLDLAINIASMQEMDPPVIQAYFEDLRATPREVHFYCCNREEKRLPDGVMTRFAGYPWSAEGEILIDELCPWHQRYYSATPPFYRSYDGPFRHRLVRLASRMKPLFTLKASDDHEQPVSKTRGAQTQIA